MPLIEYINKFYRGNQINKGFIVVNHTLYSPRRKLGI